MTQQDTSGGTADKDMQRLRDYALLVSELVHELRTPLGSIAGGASVLDQYSEKLDAHGKSRVCAGIMEQAWRLDSLFTALAALARDRTGTLLRETQVFEFNELLRGWWTADPNSNSSPGGPSLLREEVFLETDPAVVCTVLSLMLAIAARFSPEGGEASLALSLDQGDAVVSIDCALREEERSRLDNLLDSLDSGTHEQPEAKADAICLAAIREVVHSLGGQFDVWHIEADGRLCQTLGLKTSSVPAGLGKP